MAGIRCHLFGLLMLLQSSFAFWSNAQSSEMVEKFRFSITAGGRYINRDSMPDAGNLDFMNYLYGQNFGADYGLLSLNFRMAPTEKIEFSATAVLLSDLIPNQLNIDVRYKPVLNNKPVTWGMIGSFFIYPQYLENYNSFHLFRDTGFIADLDPNFRQISVYDIGIALGPTLNFSKGRFHGEINFSLGISGFVPFDERISQKKKDANLRREYHYETHYSPALFFRPEAEAGIRLMSFGKTSGGIIIKAGGMWSERSINYKRTTYTWTTEDAITNEIKIEKQWYRKFEIEGGFYLAF